MSSVRDLLQRHYSTYHEAHPIEPPPGGIPTVAGKTPIACLNCAQAKTGCDKGVPCARCKDKGLPCAARYARRSSKAALRAAQAAQAAQANASLDSQLPTPPLPPQDSITATTMNPTMMDIDARLARQNTPPKASLSPAASIAIDSVIQQQDVLSKKNSPASCHVSPEGFPSPKTTEGLDEFMIGNDFITQEPNYQDMLVWSDYPLDLDMYSGNLPITRPEVTIPTFAALSDISSSNSDQTHSSGASIHTRSTSIVSSNEYDSMAKPVDMSLPGATEIPEFEAVIAAEAAWPLARCNPPIYSGTCPRTAIVHLECLEQKSQHEGTWSALEQYLSQIDWDSADLASVVPMTSRSRDRMLAITQTFLHKALDIHRGGVHGLSKSAYSSSGMLTFLVLPPSKILEFFLRSYVRSLTFFYSLVSTGCVDPNEMLQNNQASTLLVLLMIAQGASAVPTAEARALSAGLIETCRISLFDIIEKDIEMCADPIALRSALLFTLLGAWSGDKWLMDIAMGQRGMYLSVSLLSYPGYSLQRNLINTRC